MNARPSRFTRPAFAALCLVLLALYGCEVLVKDTMRSIRADLRGGENEEPSTSPPELRTFDESTERVIEGGPSVLVVPQEPTPRVTINGGTPDE